MNPVGRRPPYPVTEQQHRAADDRGQDTDPGSRSVPEPSGRDPDPDDDVQSDVAAVELHEELRRRVRDDQLNQPGGRSFPTSGGRHARRDGAPTGRRPRLDYVPRHAVSTPGPGAVRSDAPTERFVRRHVGSDSGGPAPAPGPAPGPTGADVVTPGGVTSGVVTRGPTGPTRPVPPAGRVAPTRSRPNDRYANRTALGRPAAPTRPRQSGLAEEAAAETTAELADVASDAAANGAAPNPAPNPAAGIVDSVAAAIDALSGIHGAAPNPAVGERGGTLAAEPADTRRDEADEADDADDADPIGALFPAKRERVVLSQRQGATSPRPVRMVVDVLELTEVGEVVSANLIRSQLALALRVGGIAVIALGSLPAIFVVFPVLGRVELFGLRLPWLVLGLLAYPFLLGLGYLYARAAEYMERMFVDYLQN